MNRLSWDEYFIEFAKLASKRSTCFRKVGAVIVKDNHIISTGYNGSPSGLDHCAEKGGCMRRLNKIPSGTKQEYCRAVHAEQNAIIQAALHGVSTKDSTLYTNTYPCSICARMLINAGVKRIVYLGDYEDELSKQILKEANVKIEQLNKEVSI